MPLLKLICAIVILKANKSVSGLLYNYYTLIFLSKMKKGSSLKKNSMPVNFIQTRGEIGVFYNRCQSISISNFSISKNFKILLYVAPTLTFQFYFVFLSYFLGKLLHLTLIFLKNKTRLFCYCSFFIAAFEIMVNFWFDYFTIVLSNDVETIQVPVKTPVKCFQYPIGI